MRKCLRTAVSNENIVASITLQGRAPSIGDVDTRCQMFQGVRPKWLPNVRSRNVMQFDPMERYTTGKTS